MQSLSYDLYIDTGGTFTDCIAVDSDGRSYRRKVLSNSTIRGNIKGWTDASTIKIEEFWELEKDILAGYQFKILQENHEDVFVKSYDVENCILFLSAKLPTKLFNKSLSFELFSNEEAPILGARMITLTSLGEQLPALNIKLGSTKGTNALLEKKGADIVLFVTKGFRDILHIGTQQRPDIFALNIIKPSPLPKFIVEVEERMDAGGNILVPLKTDSLQKRLLGITSGGTTTAAIVFMNSYRNSVHEKEFANFLKNCGFIDISVSSELSKLIKFLPRTETTTVNAYLFPVINNYLKNVLSVIREGSLHVMTSAGGLIKARVFQPKDSLLSGPAGGVVGASIVGKMSGYDHLITFDMGGTSTDVARYDNDFDYKFELIVGNAHINSPALAIETVAAGGGSVCYFDGYKLCVGPESAGAFPGPACYGAGGPLTITDINLLCGRLDIQQFGIPVFIDAAKLRLEELINNIESATGQRREKEEILLGFLEIANEIMASAIKKISVAKGYDPNSYTLLAFGGAGGLHACEIARLLNIKKIIVPADAGLLSAYGLGNALIERFVEKQILLPFKDVRKGLPDIFKTLEKEAKSQLITEGVCGENSEIRVRALYIRFEGQEASVEIPYNNTDSIVPDFREKYEQIYGHWVDNREIEIESIRVVASAKRALASGIKTELNTFKPTASHYIKSFFEGKWQKIPVYIRSDLNPGAEIKGFSLLLDKHSTSVIEKGWRMLIDHSGSAIIDSIEQSEITKKHSVIEDFRSHEIELELFTNRFMSIAENMGSMLQRTALSVNIKERLDFSCAILNSKGELVANAPHIPVHLGSLGVCVRSLIDSIPMKAGDTVVTNHLKFGGSHLPDITLVTPVFFDKKKLVGFVVNRAHHAEIGGSRPASMPPDAKNLEEEGVIIAPFYLARNNHVDWKGIRKILEKGPFPTRAVEENIADLNAALAANRNGELALKNLVEEFGLKKVNYYMDALKSHASAKTAGTLSNIPNGKYEAREFLDDNTKIQAGIIVKDNTCIIDFNGSAGVHPGNMNATPAIVNGVVIYVLRILLNEPIPLNDGMLIPVKLIIPEGIFNPEFPDDPKKCPAVVGGNVEVSQRLTDTLLKAFKVVACSQGTMNNLLFGNENYSYYETICGGCGAGKNFNGASAVHHHMTNTRITDPEIIEHRYPVRIERFEIREGSGGNGKFKGGDGVIREITFLEPVSLSLLSQHRSKGPYGLSGGKQGKKGEQYVIRKDGKVEKLNGVDGTEINSGERFVIKTPGGGGFGEPEDN